MKKEFKNFNSGTLACINGLYKTRKYLRVNKGLMKINKKGQIISKAPNKSAIEEE
jgi:hypothetical protein